jgi:hypothetical protein
MRSHRLPPHYHHPTSNRCSRQDTSLLHPLPERRHCRRWGVLKLVCRALQTHARTRHSAAPLCSDEPYIMMILYIVGTQISCCGVAVQSAVVLQLYHLNVLVQPSNSKFGRSPTTEVDG